MRSGFLARHRDPAQPVDKVDQTSEAPVDGVLQDFLIQVGVLVREHVSHPHDAGPFLWRFGLQEVWTDLADGVDRHFEAMTHGVANQDVVEGTPGQVLLELPEMFECVVEVLGS